jgi:hypothetical protein
MVCPVLWAAWNRRRPPLAPFFTFFLCCSMIDVLRAVEAAGHLPLQDGGIMVVGILLCTYAAYDQLSSWNRSFRCARGCR